MNSFTDADRKMLLAKAEDGFPVPVLDDAPELPARLQWALSTFRDLRTCRPVGMAGAGPIPVTAMLAYFDALGYPRYLWTAAKAFWSALDMHELAFYHSRSAAKMPEIEAGKKL